MGDAIYNEIEPYAADWLVNLANAGHIAPGHVERRSIADLRADDVRHATQFHTFAGIGGWSYALRLAGWPDDAPVWTGSCPCQPFSGAGKRKGADDARHLWPEWFRLIRECRPAIVFGEQVASGDGLAWLDAVSADLESEGYAVGAADLCAAGVGAPHVRQRLYFVADSDQQRRNGLNALLQPREDCVEASGRGTAGELADADSQQRQLGDGRRGPQGVGAQGGDERAGRSGTLGPWSSCGWLPCLDGKARPVESCPKSVADGLPADLGLVRFVHHPEGEDAREGPLVFAPLVAGCRNRVGRLRGYGNAIVPQCAAVFVRAVIETIGARVMEREGAKGPTP